LVIHLLFEMKRTLLFLFLLAKSYLGLSSVDTLTLQNLNSSWKALSIGGAVTDYTTGHEETVYFEIPSIPENVQLRITSPFPIDIWLNSQLILHGFSGEKVFDRMEDQQFYQAGAIITLYRQGGVTSEVKTELVQVMSLQNEITQLPKKEEFFKNWYLIVMVILLLTGGLFKFYFPIPFSHAFTNPLSNKMRSLSSDEAYLSFGSFDNLFVLIYFSLLLSSLLVYLGADFQLHLNKNLSGLFTLWFYIFIASLLLVLFRYLWASVLSKIFQFTGVPNIQIQDRVNFFIPVFVIGLSISLIDFSLFNWQSLQLRNTVIYALIISEIFFAVWFYFKFDKFYAHKKLMIITYLCTTEFLPGALAIYWLGQLK